MLEICEGTDDVCKGGGEVVSNLFGICEGKHDACIDGGKGGGEELSTFFMQAENNGDKGGGIVDDDCKGGGEGKYDVREVIEGGKGGNGEVGGEGLSSNKSISIAFKEDVDGKEYVSCSEDVAEGVDMMFVAAVACPLNMERRLQRGPLILHTI